MIDLQKYLPANLSNPFWIAFLEAVGEELELFKTDRADRKLDTYNIRNLNDISQLIEIANTFDLIPDRSLDNSVEYMQKIDELLNYKVKYKTTYKGYDFIFKAVNALGYVYTLYIDENEYVRGLNSSQVINNLNDITDYALPFTGFVPEYYFTVASGILDSLDDGEYYLDTGSKTLDEVYTNNPTSTLSAEYTPINLYSLDSLEYYITTLQLDYLNRGVEYNKKVAEMMQIGFQVNSIMDTSGNLDSLSGDTYSTPNLKLDCALVGSLTGDDTIDFYTVVLGDGHQILPSTTNPIAPPTDLANQIYTSNTDINARQNDTLWYVISGRSLLITEGAFAVDELNEETTIREIGIKNQAGDLILYSTFPPAKFKKKYHLSFQFYIQK